MPFLKAGVPDAVLASALAAYAGMVRQVMDNPERWLGVDQEPSLEAGRAARGLGAVRTRALGQVTPASAEWNGRSVRERIDWWLGRIWIVGGLPAAVPRVAGALADRMPIQGALGAAAAGLAVCAVAREYGRTAPDDWVPLLARVLFNRDLPYRAASVPAPAESERELADLAAAKPEDRGVLDRIPAVGREAQRAAQTLWPLARALRGLDDLFDERPRGGKLVRTIGKVPGAGIAGGWLDERGGIHKAARETDQLLAASIVRR